MDRRRFLTLSAAAAACSALPLRAQLTPPPATTPGSLHFIFFTDTHLQPELSAAQGTAQALRKIKSLKPSFCIQGGDHVMDMTLVPRDRSLMLLDLYQKTEQALDGIPVHHAIGNHDIFGREPKSGVAPTDPLYGKQAFEQRFNTKTYRSFDEKGYHFIILDSIGITAHREFDAVIDPAQLAWLKSDLAATPPGTPIIVVSHVPIVSAAAQYSPPTDKAGQAVAYQALTGLHAFLLGNPFDVLTLLEGHNVIAVFQGHTHINETVYWRNIPFITSGAVCGNWWNGSRWGTPEGFTAIELDHGTIHWHYETYGWRSVAPIPDPFAPIPHPRTQPLPRTQPDLS
jgi:3',5'-cyclic-AMP phosphodiesterase